MVNGVKVTMPNPCDAIRAALLKQNRKENHHEALEYRDLPDFIQQLRTSQSALCVKLAFEFLILTAARTSEVIGATWDEINFEDAVWTVPADRMKMDREHKVPLSPRCVDILQLAQQFNESAIVFPGRYAGETLSNMVFLMALRRMGYESETMWTCGSGA
jgi:integrase